MAKELLQGKPYSILAVDKVNEAVGILSADSKDANTFPIRYTARGAYIGAKKFFKDIGLIPGSNIESTPVKAGEFIAIKL